MVWSITPLCSIIIAAFHFKARQIRYRECDTITFYKCTDFLVYKCSAIFSKVVKYVNFKEKNRQCSTCFDHTYDISALRGTKHTREADAPVTRMFGISLICKQGASLTSYTDKLVWDHVGIQRMKTRGPWNTLLTWVFKDFTQWILISDSGANPV
jgi:hypothetical protein